MNSLTSEPDAHKAEPASTSSHDARMGDTGDNTHLASGE